MIAIYSFMIKSNREFTWRQTTIQQWYEFFEKLNILMQDYTIDYEEYYNRQMVWCVNSWWLLTWNDFKWNIWASGYCTEFTAYWNQNSTEKMTSEFVQINTWYHDIYYCSSKVDAPSQWDWTPVPYRVLPTQNYCWLRWSRQSFGQYATLFIDVWGDIHNSFDDEDKWEPFNNIDAIKNADNIQELYLISHDWKKRLFFRRKLIDSTWDFAQYRIQMLRLRWFDAWNTHNYDWGSKWSYDGKIDTWACDTSMWFVWSWDNIWWAYSGYKLPADVDDCWVDLTYWNTTIKTRNISISPVNDPDLYWENQDKQINPYMKVLIVNGIYAPAYSGSSITDFEIPIETTINMKDFYKE